MKRVYAILLIILSYALTFVTPILAAYFILSERSESNDPNVGGLLFYTVVALFGGALFISLARMINNQKTNMFKTIFKLGLKIGILTLGLIIVRYVNMNIEDLYQVLTVAIYGFITGSMVEAYTVYKYKDVIKEWGVF